MQDRSRNLLALAVALAMLALGAAMSARSDDAERARAAVRDGRFVSATSILDWLESRYYGRAIELEFEGEEDDEPPNYEVEWLTPQNHVIEFEFDARTGELLETEGRGLEEAKRP